MSGIDGGCCQDGFEFHFYLYFTKFKINFFKGESFLEVLSIKSILRQHFHGKIILITLYVRDCLQIRGDFIV